MHDLVGDADVPVTITSRSLWTVNHNYATEYSSHRIFCTGDAVHRHPPSNGLGSNTSVQDSYNLAWKLAMVIRGEAGPALLQSYNAERAPVGRQIVERANLSRDQFGPVFEALGIAGGDDDSITAGLAACREESEAGDKRRLALHEAIELKTTSSTHTGSSSTSGTAPRPFSVLTRRNRGPGIPSSTTSPRPGPGPSFRAPGWSTSAGDAPPHWTSWAAAASRL